MGKLSKACGSIDSILKNENQCVAFVVPMWSLLGMIFVWYNLHYYSFIHCYSFLEHLIIISWQLVAHLSLGKGLKHSHFISAKYADLVELYCEPINVFRWKADIIPLALFTIFSQLSHYFGLTKGAFRAFLDPIRDTPNMKRMVALCSEIHILFQTYRAHRSMIQNVTLLTGRPLFPVQGQEASH